MDRRQFKDMSILAILREQIRMELLEFKEFINETPFELESKVSKISKDFEELSKSENRDDHYEDHLIDEYSKFGKLHTKFQFNPLLLSIYSYLEGWLKKTCEIYDRRSFSNISIEHLAGRNYIEKSKLYLEKIAEIDLSDLETEWQRILFIQNIRNLIAHHNSNVRKNPNKPVSEQSFFQQIKNESMITLDENSGDFHINDKAFILDFISTVETYLYRVIEKSDRVKVVAQNSNLPHDMVSWGKEKTETLLMNVISGLSQLDRYEERTDEHRLSDLLFNIRGTIGGMTWNLTKLLSLFMNGKWSIDDGKLIIEEHEKGLEKIKEIYKDRS